MPDWFSSSTWLQGNSVLQKWLKVTIKQTSFSKNENYQANVYMISYFWARSTRVFLYMQGRRIGFLCCFPLWQTICIRICICEHVFFYYHFVPYNHFIYIHVSHIPSYIIKIIYGVFFLKYDLSLILSAQFRSQP